MKVIAISGVSGCGKTSVIKYLSKELSCPYLLFDDFVDEDTYPKNMKLWFKNGANLSEIKTQRFIEQLQLVKANNDAQFVLVEEPFGRCRASISSLINKVILLDLPMEVCLARVIQRNIDNPNLDSLKAIPNYLQMYDDHLREIYIELTNRIRTNADFIIRNIAAVDEVGQQINIWLNKNTT